MATGNGTTRSSLWPRPEVRCRCDTEPQTLRKKGSDLKILFDEFKAPDIKSELRGTVNKTGRIRGVLRDFFPSGDKLLHGEIEEMKESGCHFQQMLFRRKLADGAVLMLARLELDPSGGQQCPFKNLSTQ
ncbi:hypothetical protein [Microvirga zambiensis]|uniref:hypothetical protein n=1 Tax=Microvirga zambiensis TaxID=1402137 RepID=UPI00191E205A|nr:hypothetical protein [Microvirga zambiensis]